MANERRVIDELSDESKALAIDELVEKIRQLTDAAQQASANLGRVRSERDDVQEARGLTGIRARRIKDREVSAAQSNLSALQEEIRSAQVRMVNLTGSRVTGFLRGRNESVADAIPRMANLGAAYRAALGEARASGALDGRQYIGQNEVDDTIRRFQANPHADDFRDHGDHAAQRIVQQKSLGGKFAALGEKYFGKAIPLLSKVKPFFGSGGFSPIAGLRAMGPVGTAAATGIVLARQYLGLLDRNFTGLQQGQNQSILSGMDFASLQGLGGAFAAFGGNIEGASRLAGGIAAQLGQMRFGGGNGLRTMAMKYGVNLMGSGYGGTATTEEILLQMSEKMQQANGDKTLLAAMAQDFGLSADQVQMLKLGPEELKAYQDKMAGLSAHLDTPEQRKLTAEYMYEKARGEIISKVAENKLNTGIGGWWTKYKNQVKAGWVTDGIVGAFDAAMRPMQPPIGAEDGGRGEPKHLFNKVLIPSGNFMKTLDSIFPFMRNIDYVDKMEKGGTKLLHPQYPDMPKSDYVDKMEKGGTKLLHPQGDVKIPETVDGGDKSSQVFPKVDVNVKADITTSANTVSGIANDLKGPTEAAVFQGVIKAIGGPMK